MPAPRSGVRKDGEPPAAFRIRRDLPVGRHPLLAAFPGLDALPTAKRLEPDPEKRRALFEDTGIEVVSGDVWMYVAPFELPKNARRQWKPVVSPKKNCIVVGRAHLSESPAIMLFMDIYHELCHVIQRAGGAELWPPGLTYVERWTEVEAYRFVVEEARQLKVNDDFLREYLKVEWIDEAQHQQLLRALGVPIA